MITVKLSQRLLACASVDTEKVSLLITAYISKNEGLVTLRAANFDTHESLSSISLPPIRDLYQQIAQPLISHHLIPVGNTGKIIVFLADGQVFVVDLFAPAILWQYQEQINPKYLKIETPRLKYLLIDSRTNCILFTIKYGPDVFLRIYDISKREFKFFLKSSEPYEQISSACFQYELDGNDTNTLIIGGNKGSCVAMECKFAEKQDACTIFKQHSRKTSFKAHYSPVALLFFIRGYLLSMDNKKLLKSWLFEEITPRYYSKLIVEKKSTLLHNEPIRSMCVTSDNKHVVTLSERLVKVWKINDGSWVRTLRLKWVNRNNVGEFIEDCSKLALTDNDNYIVSESKRKNILFVANFNEGLALSCVKYPKVWCSSVSQNQSNPIVAVIYTKDNCKFTLKTMSVPTLRCQLIKYFRAPHPGIEESVRDISFPENQDFVLLKWSQKGSESFEGFMFNISQDQSTNMYDSDKDQDDSEESEDESNTNTDSLNAKSGLVACAQSSQKSSLGTNSANTLFWKITTWLPPTCQQNLSGKVFVGAVSGQIPIWHLHTGHCQLPYLPCMEAWMKHSVTMAFVKPNVKPPARRTYDEFSVKKSAITALAAGVKFEVSTGMPHVVASGAKDGSIIIWHSKTAALERDYDIIKSWSHRTIIRNAHSVQITSLHFMKDDDILLSASLDSNICVISTRNGSIINRLFTTTPVQQFFFVNEPDYVLAKCANDSEQRVLVFKLSSPHKDSN